MAFIANGFGQINYKFTGAGLPSGAEVTFGFKNDATLSAADAAVAFRDLWDDELKGTTADAVTLSSVLCKLGPNDTGPSAEQGVGTAGTSDQGDVLPNVCLLVQKRTALGGRHGRGRLYYPTGEATVGDGGIIGGTPLSGYQSAFGTWFDAAATANLPLYLLHATNATVATEITSLAVQSTSATQRRRLRR